MYCLRSRVCTIDQPKLRTQAKKRKRESSCYNIENTCPSKKVKKLKRLQRSSKPLQDIENDFEVDPRIKASPLELVKAALHTAIPSVLPGRCTEITTIDDFLIDHVISHTPGSLYISGPPGTGKTATVTKCLMNPQLIGTTVISVNCMRLSTSHAIYSTIYEGLSPDTKLPSTRVTDTKHRILKHITSSSGTIVLVLDEIDQLSSHTQQVLYDIFEWPSLKHSSLLLISIANSLDLTDRLLPRLRANPKTCPQLLHFNPYTSENISEIIEDRLSSLPTIYDKMAIQFCARKVSSVNGDLRKALDISRRAVELVEMGEGACGGRVTIKHVARVLEEVYGASIRESDGEDIPLQQKLVACTMLLLQNKGIREPTLAKLYEAYVKVCSKQHLKQESNGEFVCLLNMLESKGMVVIRKSKQSVLLSKVRLLLQHDELSHMLQDNTLITTILKIQL